MQIHPRDFIMTPYLQCPKCGKQEFGVLSVSDTRCQRRCRACLTGGTQRLPTIKKTIVYIDQFAFSNIMKLLSPEIKGHDRAASEPFWKELFETLSVVGHLQLAACPDSREHQHESLTSPFNKQLKRTYEHFSGGLSFADSESIKARQIAQIARCWLKAESVTFGFDAERITSGRVHGWSDRIYVTATGILPGTVENLRLSRDAIHARLTEVFKQWQAEKKSFEEVYAGEKSAYRFQFVSGYKRRYLERMQMPARIMKGDMPSLDEVLGSWEENLMSSLDFIFKVDALERQAPPKRLAEFLNSDELDKAPFNIIAAAMFASLSRKVASGQKRPPNRGTANDIEMISTLLPYCDAMFVDNECAALLKDIPKSHALHYPCRIFCKNTSSEFIGYLTKIRDSVAPEHLRLVEEVYGPDAMRPPTGISGLGAKRRGPE